ncbi:ribonuclease H-like domain-containing protein [Tanacetum coccineum]
MVNITPMFRRNRDDLDTMSLDDLYNHLKVYEPEQVSTVSTEVAAASLSHDTICAYIGYLNQCWNASIATKWHFARECRVLRSQDRGKRESYRKDPKVEEPAPKALMAINGIGWDWSYMSNEDENHALVADDVVPTEFALMVMSSSSLSSDNEVYDDSYYSKSCLSQVEARLVEFKVNETKFCERIRVLERDVEIRDNKIESLKYELEELKKEKESIDHKLAGFGLPEFVDDTITDCTRPTPSVDVLKDVRSDLDESGCPNAIKINNTENTRKPTVKYAEMYRDTSKSPKHVINVATLIIWHLIMGYGWLREKPGQGVIIPNNVNPPSTHKSMTPRAVLLKSGSKPIVVNKPKMNVAQPTMTSFKIAHSNIKRPFERKTAAKNQNWVPKVPTGRTKIPTVGLKMIPTANSKVLLIGKQEKLLRPQSACWFGNLRKILQVKGNMIIRIFGDNGCSRHRRGMTATNLPFLSMSSIWKDMFIRHGGGKITGKGTIKTEGCHSKSFENEPYLMLLVSKKSSIRLPCKTKFSNARTPQQNGVAERRNRTLIKATRTMLGDAKLPVTFWAEVVSTACYVQNRVMVNKPFGYHVMILNTLDHLGKFDAKGDKGYFVGYSLSSKAFRVFNKRTKKVEENLHVDFLENKPIKKGVGPNWLFDIDSLTNSMNYVPVVVIGTSSTNISGTKEDANQAVKDNVSSLRFIVLPNWFHDAHMETSNDSVRNSEANDVPQKEQDGIANVSERSGSTNPTVSSKDSLVDQVEPVSSPTVESEVPTVSLPVPTVSINVLDSESPELPPSPIVETAVPTVSTPIPTGNVMGDFFGDTTNSTSLTEVEADISNMETDIQVSLTPTLRINKDHLKSQIIGPIDTPVQTRHKAKNVEEQSFIATIHQKTNPDLLQYCLFSCFLSQEEPKKIVDDLKDESWVEAMQEELLQFQILNVWVLVDCS